MSQINVTVRTVEKDTTRHGGTEFKFYRTYEIPGHGTIFQWGSMRAGKEGGQFKASTSTFDASGVISKKEAEGYANRDTEYMSIDSTKINMSDWKRTGTTLDNLRAASATTASPGFQKPDPKRPSGLDAEAVNTEADPPRAPDRLTTLSKRALEAIALAANKPVDALVELSKIEAELEVVEMDMRKIRSYVGTLTDLTEETV